MDGIQNTDGREIVIRVKDVRKKFKSYKDKATSLKERFVNPSRGSHEEIMVLKGISFEVRKGEALGIIGKNGCGKSTSLKLLTRILTPNEGEISIKGRVSSLIELGAGFHPDMTGRENIYTNASIFGITRKEVTRRLDDIIRFSELEEFIDNPVRTYSSGMYMRLAFAVAINVDADVLLIDEILAVGDSGFQKKCFEKLKEIKAKGTTIVIVSHSMDQMYKICDRLIWIEDGLIRDEGVPRFIGEEYLAAMEGRRLDRMEWEKQVHKAELVRKIQEEQERILREQKREQEQQEEKRKREAAEEERKQKLIRMEQERLQIERNETLKAVCRFHYPGARRSGSGEIHYTKVILRNSNGEETDKILTGEECSLVLEYTANRPEIETKFVMGITRNDGIYCYGTSVNMNSLKTTRLKKDGVVVFTFLNELLKGKYVLDLWIETQEGHQYDCIYSLMQFEVDTVPYRERGFGSMKHKWSVDGTPYDF